MDLEEKDLLERNLRISEENNKILRGMQRGARWSTIWGFVKLFIIIVPLIAGYLYLQPYLDQILENFRNIRDLINIQSPR